MGRNPIKPGAEAGLFRIIPVDGLQDRQKNLLREVHSGFQVPGLAVNKGVDLPVVGGDQLLGGTPISLPLDAFNQRILFLSSHVGHQFEFFDFIHIFAERSTIVFLETDFF